MSNYEPMSNARLHFDAAGEHSRSGRYEEAVSCYGEAIRRTDFDPARYHFLRHIYITEPKREVVIPLLERLSREHTDSHYHFLLALIFSDQGDTDRAVCEYRQALSIDPDDSGSNYNLAQIYFNQGRYEDAIAHLRHLTQINPEATTALCRLGEAYEGAGCMDLAMQAYERALELPRQEVLSNEGEPVEDEELMEAERRLAILRGGEARH